MNTPSYTISTKIIDLVARVAEKLGEIRGARASCVKYANKQINKII